MKNFGHYSTNIDEIKVPLKMLLSDKSENLTSIAYQFEYYGQSPLIKDFKDFTGIKSKVFLSNENMKLYSAFYK